MLSDKPYLVRAMYNWIIDSDCKPYLTVDVHHDGTEVPMEYVEDGQIILNIANEAVAELYLGDNRVTFTAKFSGIEKHVIVPMRAIVAIYASENGRGMMFDPEEYDGEEYFGEEDEDGSSGSNGKKRGHLTLVT